MVIKLLLMVNNKLAGGFNLPLWKIFVNWDDDSPNIWQIKNVPNHQPDKC